MSRKKRVSYYYDNDVGAFSYGIGHVMKPHRIKMAHSLIAAYDLLPKMDVLRPDLATPEQMTKFHTDEYIHLLKRVTPETANELTEGGTKFLTGFDNPPYEGAFEFNAIAAGGSISGAVRLASGSTDVAINWAGGLHHAKKTAASGFCYINDIVLGILELLRTFPRVLYVDVDCHHGDAVEEAFYTSDRVLTCSLHKFGDFFPGTGLCDDRGVGKGFRYSLNVPFRSGLSDENFHSVYVPLMDRILARFRPSVVVLQCGADSLAGDRLGQYNVSMEGHADCVRYFRDKGLPLMMLGGGGYTIRNVARTWAYETACILECENELDRDLPYNAYFEYFGPEYKLEVKPSNVEDLNESDKYLDGIRETVLRQADEIPIAPSVGIHMPPRHSLAEELGLGLDGQNHVDGDYDDIDLKIQELSAKFISSAHSTTSDTESTYSRSPYQQDARWGNSEDEEEEFGTPTRTNGRKRGPLANAANRVGSRQGEVEDNFTRGTIPMHGQGLLFQGRNGVGGSYQSGSVRPPDSVGSVFGSAGRSMAMNPSNVLGLGPDSQGMSVSEIMERGGMIEASYNDSIVVAEELPLPEKVHGRENAHVSGGSGSSRPSRRFFKSSGIRLRGLNEVQFPLSVLNGPVGRSWGPAGFEGFGNEAHVMRRGYGFSYGYGVDVNANADAGGGGGEEETTTAKPVASARRGRYSKRDEEEMEVDGAESD
ncbi:hypothetical protein FRC19_010853 [Serendipita sp. 401]|nr:hypothetical protein FRC15_010987 [Serendipita sp. 397]KAG8825649.1 hypothetical protein FRC19_010853 [Serendipita sp. 401]KAG9056380.1 hypothetical protein FS842_010836 [Serendipita sp. 407]